MNKNQSGFTPIVLILIIAAVLAAGGGGYYLYQKSNLKSQKLEQAQIE